MRFGVYRDAEAIGEYTDELRIEAAEREALLSELILACVPSELAARLARGRRAAREVVNESGTFPVQSELVQYVRALDEAIRLLPDIEASLRELPRDAPVLTIHEEDKDAQGAPPEPVRRFVHACLCSTLRRMSRDVVIEPAGDRAFRALLRMHDAPIALGVAMSQREAFTDFAILVGTSVARRSPRVVVREKGIVEDWFWRGSLTGDPAFDGLFAIEGGPPALSILSKQVQHLLSVVARCDVPRLEIEGGRATLGWRFEPTESALDAAIRALVRVRNATARL